jgi:hypothetical protein
MQKWIILVFAICLVQMAIPVHSNPDQPSRARHTRNILFVVDCSKYMNKRLADRNKLEEAKLAINKILMNLPSDLNCGLRVFGCSNELSNEYKIPEKQFLGMSSLVSPIGSSRKNLMEQVELLQPTIGRCNLQAALHSAVRTDLAEKSGDSIIVLITGNIDDCGGNASVDAECISHEPRLKLVMLSMSQDQAVQHLNSVIARTAHGAFYGPESIDAFIDKLHELMI